MTNQTIRTQITLLCNSLGYGVNFRGGSDAHLATVTAREGNGFVTIVSGRLAKVLDYIECVAA
jgi:hypothetical protein